MNYFDPPARWLIPEAAFQKSLNEMKIDGMKGNEGVAMWLGRYEDNIAIVTHVGILRGRGVSKGPAQLIIGASLINRLTDVAIAGGLTLIGQIHSHGPLHGVALSRVDKQLGIAVPGYLSAVAPDYAMRPITRLQDCGIHLFDRKLGWTSLSSGAISSRISIVPGRNAQIILIGEG